MKQEKNETGLAGHNTYQSPMTYRNRVETEGGLCDGSADIKNLQDNSGVGIDAHEVNSGFGYELKDGASWEKQ